MTATEAPAQTADTTPTSATQPLTEPQAVPTSGEAIRPPTEPGDDPFSRPFPEKDAEADAPDAPEAPDAAPEGEKSAEDASDAEIKLDLPEGSLLEQEDVDDLAAFAKESGLTQEQADKLLEREAAKRDAITDGLAQERVKWGDMLAADKEFGGDAVEKTRLGAAMALHELEPSFYAELKESGWIDYPPLVKFAARVSTLLREPDHATPAPAGGEAKSFDELDPKAQYERLFSKSNYPGS
jgi:hypothetical protein